MRHIWVYFLAAATVVGLRAHTALATDGAAGALYTMSNAVAGNEILVFDRASDGTLTPAGSYPTGGVGSGGGLGNQSALIFSEDQRFLIAVNAGSNDVSVFAITADGLTLVDRRASGGEQPVSLTEENNLVYVLNAGSDSIFGFALRESGRLVPKPLSNRSLGEAGTGAAQIAFSQDGQVLVVTEKNTNAIVTFRVVDGVPTQPQTFASVAPTPFGFSFGFRDQLIVSEAAGGSEDASSVSSYAVSRRGDLDLISPAVGTTQTAACWIVVTPDGRFAYTTNAGSGSISTYRIAFDGTLTLAAAVGGETGDGSSPIDMAMTPDGRFLYALNSGNETISAFDVGVDGALTPLVGINGLPDGANGLAVR